MYPWIVGLDDMVEDYCRAHSHITPSHPSCVTWLVIDRLCKSIVIEIWQGRLYQPRESSPSVESTWDEDRYQHLSLSLPSPAGESIRFGIVLKLIWIVIRFHPQNHQLHCTRGHPLLHPISASENQAEERRESFGDFLSTLWSLLGCGGVLVLVLIAEIESSTINDNDEQFPCPPALNVCLDFQG